MIERPRLEDFDSIDDWVLATHLWLKADAIRLQKQRKEMERVARRKADYGIISIHDDQVFVRLPANFRLVDDSKPKAQ